MVWKQSSIRFQKIRRVGILTFLVAAVPFIRYVLYKERNMLLTEKNLSRRKNLKFPQPERWKKVKRSMAAIKVVLGERKREKIAVFREGKVKEEAMVEEEEQAS